MEELLKKYYELFPNSHIFTEFFYASEKDKKNVKRGN